ncbi:hypothetical protein J4558_21005 [Leptolyngbya sp. 15MV]|nr:hypothetical protein J4558_21005 [Leptolyngbya sp. 15MV]
MNPKTNNRSLIPVYKDQADGQWKVARSDRFMLEQVQGATNKVVDTSTLLVRVAGQDATRVR